jgi:hypothetical protein
VRQLKGVQVCLTHSRQKRFMLMILVLLYWMVLMMLMHQECMVPYFLSVELLVLDLVLCINVLEEDLIVPVTLFLAG